MAKDFYGILGVPKTADADAIKKAYRKLAKDLHPDKNPGNAHAEARFKGVNQAFDVLSDPTKRKLYDEFGDEGLREGFDAEQARAHKQWQARGGDRNPFGGGRVSLEDLFGGMGGGGGDVFSHPRRRGPQKGHDYEQELTIDFATALRGTMLEVRSPHEGTVQVRIPAGADEGSRLKIPGQGAPSSSGGPPGDLFLNIHVRPHPLYKREGADLKLDLPVTPLEAYGGAKVKVPTVDGSVTVKVPPHTQSGTVLRVRGKGVAMKGKEAGDLYVRFVVHIPTKESAELADLFQRAEQHFERNVREDIVL